MSKEAIFQGIPPTRFMVYPSLEFIVQHKSKYITPIGPILVQTYMQYIYREIRKGSLLNINNGTNSKKMPTQKKTANNSR